jgi:hypothetical protein
VLNVFELFVYLSSHINTLQGEETLLSVDHGHPNFCELRPETV